MYYPVGPGTIDVGRDFENKTAALLSLRFLSTDGFSMGINMKNYQPVDDIILKLKHVAKQNNSVAYDEFFFQSAQSKYGDFSLQKYFEGYKNILENKSKLRMLTGVDHIYFVLFTNRTRKDDFGFLIPVSDNPLLDTIDTSKNKSIFKIDYNKLLEQFINMNNFVGKFSGISELQKELKSCKTLQTNQSKFLLNLCAKIPIDFNKLHEVIKSQLECFNSADFRSFLDDFILYFDQVNQANIDELAKNEITKYCTEQHNLTTITESYFNYLSKWAKGLLDKNFTLTKTMVNDKLVDILLDQFRARYKRNENGYKNMDKEIDLWDTIVKEQNITLIEKDDTVYDFIFYYICCVINKICRIDIFNMQNQKTCLIPLSDKDKQTILDRLRPLDTNRILHKLNSINSDSLCLVDVFKSLWVLQKIPLILEINSGEDYEGILHILNNCECNYKFIIIYNNAISKFLESKNLRVLSTLSDLTHKVRSDVLSKRVMFQGKSAKLRNLINGDMISKVLIKDVIHIITGKYSVGNGPNAFPDFYIEQNLSKIIIKPQALRECRDDIFIIKCENEHIVKEIKSEHLLQLNYEDNDINVILTRDNCFGSILKEYPNKFVQNLLLNRVNETKLQLLIPSDSTVFNARALTECTDEVFVIKCESEKLFKDYLTQHNIHLEKIKYCNDAIVIFTKYDNFEYISMKFPQRSVHELKFQDRKQQVLGLIRSERGSTNIQIYQTFPNIIKPKALYECSKDVFVIRCENENIFKEYLKHHKIDSRKFLYATAKVNSNVIFTENDRCVKVSDYASNQVHELIINNNKKLELIRTEGGICNIQHYKAASELVIQSSELTGYLNNRLSLICAGPGMGKTTLLDYIFKEMPTAFWVLRIDLKNYLDYYDSTDFNNNHTNPSKHLEYFNNEILPKDKNSEISKEVFKNFLSKTSVFVIFDGLDEVPTVHEKNVTEMIKSLYKTNFKMILTTRPVMQTYAEQNFNTLGLTLNPFNKTDQILFFNKYFANKIINPDEDRMKKFINKLLELTQKNLNDLDCQFTGVPLQCRLLAEVFTSNCINYVSTGTFDLNENFDLLFLYEEFVRAKIKILKDKYGIYLPYSDDIIENYQTLFAFKIIFPEKFKEPEFEPIKTKLKQYKVLIIDLEKKVQKDGIVTVNKELNLNFVHRTFGEYFVAKWLSENFDSDDYKDLARSLIKLLFDDNFNVVRNIFDRILAKGNELHLAVINKLPYEDISIIIKKTPNIIKKLDKGERSALHLAAAWGLKHPLLKDNEAVYYKKSLPNDPMVNICQLLISEGIDNEKDTLLNYYALDYSILNNSLSVADIISTKFEEITKIPLNTNIMQYITFCSYCDSDSLMCLILKQILKSNSTNDYFMGLMKAGKLDVHKNFDLVTFYENFVKIKLELLEDEHGYEFKETVRKYQQIYALKSTFDYSSISGLDVDHKLDKCLRVIGNAKNNEFNINLIHKSFEKYFVAQWLTENYKEENYRNVVVTLFKILFEENFNDIRNIFDRILGKGKKLHLAIINRVKYEDICQIIRENNNIVKQVDKGGRSALHLVAGWGLKFPIIKIGEKIDKDESCIYDKKDTMICRLLLKSGVGNENDELFGYNPLDYSILSNTLAVANCISGEYNNINIKLDNYNFEMYLHYYMLTKGNNLIKTLNNYFNMNNITTPGQFKIYNKSKKSLAEQFKSYDIHKMLLNESKLGNVIIAAYLINVGADVNIQEKFNGATPLLYLATTGNPDILKRLIEKKADINKQDQHEGNTPLLESSRAGNLDNVRCLIENGAKINSQNNKGYTALIWASMNDHLKIVEYLVQKQAAIDIQDRYDHTALLHASKRGKLEIVKHLIEHGANINHQDNDGNTPLFRSAMKGYLDIVRYLVKKGADVNKTNKDGHTVLQVAKKHTEVMNYLKPIFRASE